MDGADEPSTIRRSCRRVARWLWRQHETTKAFLTLDIAGMTDAMPGVTDPEMALARAVFDGGRPPTERDGGLDAPPGLATARAGTGAGGEEGDEGIDPGPYPDLDNSSANGPDDDRSPFDVGGDYGWRHRIAFVLGPATFAFLILAPTPTGLTPAGQATAAVTAWVAIWWMGEAIPIPATSLLPLLLFPLTGALSLEATAPAYADPLIFLFMGGFFLAMAMQRWGLHRRIALRTIVAVGTQPARLILGFMLATAFLSMWVSNTATVMMMVPIALATIYQTATLIEDAALDIDTETGSFTFGLALMLCIAYGASVGGVGTLIGTPPNILFAGQAGALFGVQITFFQWMLYGVPIAVVGLVTVYLWVTRIAVAPAFESIPLAADAIDRELDRLGPMRRQERLVLVVFVGMACSWIGASLLGQAGVVDLPADIDAIIAIAGALVLFSIPTRTSDGEFTFLLDWTHGVEIPWGVILLFGGGLAIAAAFGETGLAAWIGEQLVALEAVTMVLIILAVVGLTVFLTEVTSNTATTAMLMPILAGLAIGISVHPFGLMIAGATAASFAFMLPVATPPNAIVFGSGYITIPQMAKVGFGLNLLGILLITLVAIWWLPVAWGIDVTTLPPEFVEAWSS